MTNSPILIIMDKTIESDNMTRPVSDAYCGYCIFDSWQKLNSCHTGAHSLNLSSAFIIDTLP